MFVKFVILIFLYSKSNFFETSKKSFKAILSVLSCCGVTEANDDGSCVCPDSGDRDGSGQKMKSDLLVVTCMNSSMECLFLWRGAPFRGRLIA